jgi:hypothetical protein
MRIPRLGYVAVWLALFVARPARAQTLQDLVGQLFVFGGRSIPLQVGTQLASTPSGTTAVEDNGYGPAAVQANAAVLDFLTRWVGAAPGYFPVGSTSGGVTFTFEGGLPMPSAVAGGPIFAERATTLGRGRGVTGVRFNSTQFNTSRGTPIKDLRLNFTHTNVDGDECDAQEGQDCAPLGVPMSENDVLEVLLTLDLDVDVAALFATYGLTDWLDVGVVLPLVHTNLDAHTVSQIIPFGTLPTGASHFIAGTPENPVLSSTQVARGSATGIGDLAGRIKVNVATRGRAAVSFLGDVRAPTGDERDFMGAPDWAVRGYGILSMQYGSFSPHLNAGYVWRGDAPNGVTDDAVLATVGFDQALASWVTLSADLISELQIGQSVFQVPAPVTFAEPFVRSVRPLEVPEGRDNIASMSLGFRFATLSSITGLVDALVPVTGSSPRPDFAWSLGVEYDF